jgi:cytochrome c-type biogenesis protein CcmH/NrfG
MTIGWRGGFLLLALAAALPPAGCGKGAPPPEAEPVRLGTESEIENYKAVLRREPNNLHALIGLGNIYYQTNRDREAMANFEKALALDPSNPNVRTDLAVCLRRTGNCDRAVEELKKAIASDPRHPQSRYNLGVILVQDKKDLEGGIRAWEGLLENVPGYPYRDQLKLEIERLRAGIPPASSEASPGEK